MTCFWVRIHWYKKTRGSGSSATPVPHPPAALIEFGLISYHSLAVLLLPNPLYYFYHPPH